MDKSNDGHEGYEPSCPIDLAVMLEEIAQFLKHNQVPLSDRLAQTVWILRAFERYLIRKRRFVLAYDISWTIHRINEAGNVHAIRDRLRKRGY